MLAVVVEIEQAATTARGVPASQLGTGHWTRRVPSRPRIAQRLERPASPLEDLERYYGAGYAAGLYPA